jgi:hypothetical protein
MDTHAQDSHYPADAAGDHADDATAADHAAEHGVAAGPPPTGSSEPVTPLSAFSWPGLIALITLILVIGPITRAFAPYTGSGYDADGRPVRADLTPAAAPTGTVGLQATIAATTPGTGVNPAIPLPTEALTAVPTNVQTGGDVTATAVPVYPTDTPVPATDTPAAPASPTTAAIRPPTEAEVRAGAPRVVTVGGKEFRVEVSNTTLPDWPFSRDPAVANWVSGTVINYVLGLSYNDANAALFKAVQPSDTVRLARADGTVYTFVVDQVTRVALNDTHLLQQDHPAITLVLLGDPATDRAVVQGHYSEPAGQ